MNKNNVVVSTLMASLLALLSSQAAAENTSTHTLTATVAVTGPAATCTLQVGTANAAAGGASTLEFPSMNAADIVAGKDSASQTYTIKLTSCSGLQAMDEVKISASTTADTENGSVIGTNKASKATGVLLSLLEKDGTKIELSDKPTEIASHDAANWSVTNEIDDYIFELTPGKNYTEHTIVPGTSEFPVVFELAYP